MRVSFVPLVAGNVWWRIKVFIGDKRITAEERRLICRGRVLVTFIAIARIATAKTAKRAELLTELEKGSHHIIEFGSHELQADVRRYRRCFYFAG